MSVSKVNRATRGTRARAAPAWCSCGAAHDERLSLARPYVLLAIDRALRYAQGVRPNDAPPINGVQLLDCDVPPGHRSAAAAKATICRIAFGDGGMVIHVPIPLGPGGGGGVGGGGNMSVSRSNANTRNTGGVLSRVLASAASRLSRTTSAATRSRARGAAAAPLRVRLTHMRPDGRMAHLTSLEALAAVVRDRPRLMPYLHCDAAHPGDLRALLVEPGCAVAPPPRAASRNVNGSGSVNVNGNGNGKGSRGSTNKRATTSRT